MKSILRSIAVVIGFIPLSLAAQDKRFLPAGEIPPEQGDGVRQSAVLYPNMRFPIKIGPAFANSQVYLTGGMYGPPGDQCAVSNYSYPWRDNFCETRGHPNLLCKTGRGHQGQDIRPKTCDANVYWTVAVEDGLIAQIGTFSVTLQGKSGTIYRYLHLDMKNLAVKLLQKVKQGDEIGRVSNTFKTGTPTTKHLHFEIIDAVRIGNRTISTFIPPYSSLIAAYKRLPKEEQK